jgi:anti-anti-sigma regulatory factor
MLGRLIRFKESLANANGKLVLCNLQAKVHRVFAQTRLTKTFDIQTNQSEGLAAF